MYIFLLFLALLTFATSRTRKYYLGTDLGRQDMADLIETMRALLNAGYAGSIVAYDGSTYNQTDYEVVGNVSALWKASLVYPSNKDLLRRSNLVYTGKIPEVISDFSIVNPKSYSTIEDAKKAKIDPIKGKILTPTEVKIIADRYNENQKENALTLVPLEGVKGVELFDLKAFCRPDTMSIYEGNVSGTVPAEVSIIYGYSFAYPTAVIDEISMKAVESWLLSNKSTT